MSLETEPNPVTTREIRRHRRSSSCLAITGSTMESLAYMPGQPKSIADDAILTASTSLGEIITVAAERGSRPVGNEPADGGELDDQNEDQVMNPQIEETLQDRPSRTFSAPISIPVSPRHAAENGNGNEEIGELSTLVEPIKKRTSGSLDDMKNLLAPSFSSPALTHSQSSLSPYSSTLPLRRSGGKRGSEVELHGRDGGFVVRRTGGPDATKKSGYLVKLGGIRFTKAKKRWYGFQGTYLVYWRLQEVR